MELVKSVTKEGLSVKEIVLSVTNKGISMSKEGLSVTNKGISMSKKKGLSVTNKRYSMSKEGLSVTNKGISMSKEGLSVMKLVLSVTNKGISMGKEGLSKAVKPSPVLADTLFTPKTHLICPADTLTHSHPCSFGLRPLLTANSFRRFPNCSSLPTGCGEGRWHKRCSHNFGSGLNRLSVQGGGPVPNQEGGEKVHSYDHQPSCIPRLHRLQ